MPRASTKESGALRLAHRDEHRGARRSLVDQLIEQALVKDFGDLYHLTGDQLENLVVTPKEPRSAAPSRAASAKSDAT
jgi:NAD-dependent DNA ligase